MRAVWIAASLLLCGAEGFGLDVLHMKRGDTVEGIILKETESEVLLRTLFMKRDGRITSTATAPFPKSEVKRIERMPGAERAQLIARAEAFSKQGMHLMNSLRRITPVRVKFRGRIALRTEGKRFQITSTCDEALVREVTHYLEEMFAAYEQDFRVGGDLKRKIRVYLFADVDEYNRYQRDVIGHVVDNPALYNPDENRILAYSRVEKGKAAGIRAQIEQAQRSIRAEKAKVDDFDKQVRDKVREMHKEVQKQVAAARRRIQRDAGGNKAGRLRDLEDRKKKAYRRIKNWERERKKEGEAFRDKADEAMRKNRRVILRNNRVLAAQNKLMFETLFHEGFHAFERGFLWTSTKAMLMTRWLNEGLSVYYEGSVVEAGYLIHGGAHPHYLALLRRAMKQGKLIPLDRLLVAGPQQFMVAAGTKNEHAGLFYAQSWLLAHYMADRVPRRKMQAYVQQVAAGMPSRTAFEAMMGMPVKQVHAELRVHAATMK